MKTNQSPPNEAAPFAPAASVVHLRYIVTVDNHQDARRLIAEIESSSGITPVSITDDFGNEVTL